MNAIGLYIIVGLVFALVAAFITRSLRGASRLQRRLFLLFLLLSFLPAAVTLLVNWQMSQRHLGFLESPGLRGALESSLDLARLTLERERELTQALTDEIAQAVGRRGESPGARGGAQEASEVDLPPVPPGGAFRLVGAATSGIVGENNTARDLLKSVDPATILAPVRMASGGRTYLVAVASVAVTPAADAEPPRVILARPLPEDLAAGLGAIAEGGSRYRQLRLLSTTLLRGDTLLTLAVLGLLLMIASLWLSRRLARQIGGPLRELARGTEIVAAGDLEHRVRTRAVDELGDLVDAFNRMTGELQRSKDELVRAERIAAWQGVARRLAHEIKNPLTPIGLAMHRIRMKADDPVVAECVEAVLEETENLKRLADEFSLYARLPAPEKEPVAAGELLRGVVEMYLARAAIEVRWEGWEEDSPVPADPGQLRQVFSNLVKNAVEAMEGRGTLVLLRQQEGGWLTITVQDTGPGLPAATGEVFRPYVTTKEAGTGLGLAIAQKIVADHGGRLEATTAPEGGAVFKVVLPVGDDAAAEVIGRTGEEVT